MKRFFLLAAVMAPTLFSLAQGVKIADFNTSPNPDAAAVLELESTSRGLLQPRLTTAQRDLISTPVPAGLRIFNTDTGCENFYDGSSWRQICGECDFAAPTLASNSPVCAGSTLNLTASAISGATYSWTGPNGFTSSQQNPSISNASTLASGVYSVVATVGGCSAEPISISVTVNAAPSNPVATNDGPVCEGGDITLTASSVPGASYSWSGPNGFSSTQQNPPTLSGVTAANTGTYTVTASVPGCPGAQGSTNVAVNSVPGTPTGLSATGGNGKATITFTAPSDGGSPITVYTATSTPGGITGTSANDTIVVTGLTNGTSYTFTVYATNICGDGPVSSASGSVTPTTPNGCSNSATYAYKIADDLWACAPDNIQGNNNFIQMATACNNAENFYLATVGPMTRRGLPSQAEINNAETMSQAASFQYFTTGHPTRFFKWDRSQTPYESTSCGSGGTGYISVSEGITGSNWAALVDGNEAELRSWPAANCVEVSYHTLISLCMDASGDTQSYIYDYRWR